MSLINAFVPNHSIYKIAGILAEHFDKCTPDRVEKMILQEFRNDMYVTPYESAKPQNNEEDTTIDMFSEENKPVAQTQQEQTNAKPVYDRPNSRRKRCVTIETDEGIQRFSYATELFKHFGIQNTDGTHAFPRYILREAANEAECVKAEARYLNEHIKGGIKQYIRFGTDGKQHVYKFKGATAI